MIKVRVIVYDQVFGSQEIPKAATLLIQDGGVKGYHGATNGVRKNPWWFGEHWGCGCFGGVLLGEWRRWCFSPCGWYLVERWSSGDTLNTHHQPGEAVGRILMSSREESEI